MRASFKSVDTVLRFERILSKAFPADKKYEMVSAWQKAGKDYSVEYARAYQPTYNGRPDPACTSLSVDKPGHIQRIIFYLLFAMRTISYFYPPETLCSYPLKA